MGSCSLSGSASNIDIGRLYISGGAGAGADTANILTIPSAQSIGSVQIYRLTLLYDTVDMIIIDTTVSQASKFRYDEYKDQFVLFFQGNNGGTAQCYNKSTGGLGTLNTTTTNRFIIRFDNNLNYIKVNDDTDNFYTACQDFEGNFVMIEQIPNNLTIGGVNYTSGDTVYALFSAEGNYLTSRLITSSGLRSNYMCAFCSNNVNYFLHTGKIDSSFSINGVPLTNTSGDTEVFSWFSNTNQIFSGICNETVLSGNPCEVQIKGVYNSSATLTQGLNYYNSYSNLVDDPSLNNKKVGVAISANELLLD